MKYDSNTIDKICKTLIYFLIKNNKECNENTYWIEWNTTYPKCKICNSPLPNTVDGIMDHGIDHLRERKLLAFL